MVGRGGTVDMAMARFAACGSLVAVDLSTLEDTFVGGFVGCGWLERVVLPPRARTLGGWSFMYCWRLSTIAGVTLPMTLEPDALRGTPSLQRLGWEDWVESIGARAVCMSGLRRLVLSSRCVALVDLSGALMLGELRLPWDSTVRLELGGCSTLRSLAVGRVQMGSCVGLHLDVIRYSSFRVGVGGESFVVAVEHALVLGELAALARRVMLPALPP